MILVIGGTGKTGRRIVQRLEDKGFAVRVGSRPVFDWDDPSTWAPALDGIDAAYVAFYPDLAVPGAPEAIERLAAVAKAAGVRKLVLLSGRGEDEALASEKVVQDSGLAWTVVRASWFSQNFSENYLLEPVLAGEVVLPVGEVAEPFVDAEDIADVAVAALTESGHDGEVYEVTGPRLLTFAAAVAEIAEATGRDVKFISVEPGDYAKALLAEGVPADVVDLLIYLFTTVLDGRNEHLTDGVRRALGREPRDFADYVKATASTGIWDPAI